MTKSFVNRNIYPNAIGCPAAYMTEQDLDGFSFFSSPITNVVTLRRSAATAQIAVVLSDDVPGSSDPGCFGLDPGSDLVFFSFPLLDFFFFQGFGGVTTGVSVRLSAGVTSMETLVQLAGLGSDLASGEGFVWKSSGSIEFVPELISAK